jgi:hypothetical protein
MGYPVGKPASKCGIWNLQMAALVAAVLITTVGIGPAAAQSKTNSGTAAAATCPDQPEMTFSEWSSDLGQRFGQGPREYIFADGYICSDTDKNFQDFLKKNPPKTPNTTVVLNSGGGDLAAGMRMGLVIREQKLWTQVGSEFPLMIPENENIKPEAVPYLSEPAAPPFAGNCASACTLTFMGGVNRTINYASNYGVHQFEAADENPNSQTQSQTEAAAAAIVAYLSKMGVSPNYMVYMVKKTGNDVTNLTMAELQQLNIVTPRWQTKWQITTLGDQSGFSLDGVTTDPWGTHDITFACIAKANALQPVSTTQQDSTAGPSKSDQTKQPPAVKATFSLDPGVRAKAQDLAGNVEGYVLELSGVFVPLVFSAKHTPATVAANRLTTTLQFTPGEVTALETFPNIGLAFVFNPSANLPMRMLKFESSLDGALLKQFAATCH